MSKYLIIPAPAKLNLYLHIKNKLSSGYHCLESFIIFINMYDIISIKKSSTDIFNITGPSSQHLKCSNKEDNLVYKVTTYIKQEFKINNCIEITLNKNIPIGAGLGGGSADAAAILKALNTFWHLKLNKKELSEIAIKFGADIPSCIYSQSGLIEGIGEKYTSIPLKFHLHILLVSNLPILNTKDVYTKYIYRKNTLYSSPLLNIDSKSDFLKFLKRQSNDLTEPAIQLLPHLKNVLRDLNSTKPIFARITGSGSSCFAVYSTIQNILQALNKMHNLYPYYSITYVTNLI